MEKVEEKKLNSAKDTLEILRKENIPFNDVDKIYNFLSSKALAKQVGVGDMSTFIAPDGSKFAFDRAGSVYLV